MTQRVSIGLATAMMLATLGQGCREGVLDSVNHAPIVQSVVATPSIVLAGQQITLRVEATDEDGDGIRYFWASERGEFDVVIGESVRWTAPSTGGDYWVEVNASDRVASTTADLRIRVRAQTP